MKLEERLHDALSAYRDQITVSPDLLGRIETRVERRRTWSSPQGFRPLAIAMVVVAILALSIAVLRSTGGDHGASEAAAHRATVDGADRTCLELDRALGAAQIVFETPAAYESVSAARADIAHAAADRIRRTEATARDRTRVVAAIADFEAAAHAADRARAAAARGDLAGARGEFEQFDRGISSGRTELGALGAERCNEEDPAR
jgi:hypothetical protein